MTLCCSWHKYYSRTSLGVIPDRATSLPVHSIDCAHLRRKRPPTTPATAPATLSVTESLVNRSLGVSSSCSGWQLRRRKARNDDNWAAVRAVAPDRCSSAWVIWSACPVEQKGGMEHCGKYEIGAYACVCVCARMWAWAKTACARTDGDYVHAL